MGIVGNLTVFGFGIAFALPRVLRMNFIEISDSAKANLRFLREKWKYLPPPVDLYRFAPQNLRYSGL